MVSRFGPDPIGPRTGPIDVIGPALSQGAGVSREPGILGEITVDPEFRDVQTAEEAEEALRESNRARRDRDDDDRDRDRKKESAEPDKPSPPPQEIGRGTIVIADPSNEAREVRISRSTGASFEVDTSRGIVRQITPASGARTGRGLDRSQLATILEVANIPFPAGLDEALSREDITIPPSEIGQPFSLDGVEGRVTRGGARQRFFFLPNEDFYDAPVEELDVIPVGGRFGDTLVVPGLEDRPLSIAEFQRLDPASQSALLAGRFGDVIEPQAEIVIPPMDITPLEPAAELPPPVSPEQFSAAILDRLDAVSFQPGQDIRTTVAFIVDDELQSSGLEFPTPQERDAYINELSEYIAFDQPVGPGEQPPPGISGPATISPFPGEGEVPDTTAFQGPILDAQGRELQALPSREWMLRSDFDALTPDQKQLVMAVGIAGYNRARSLALAQRAAAEESALIGMPDTQDMPPEPPAPLTETERQQLGRQQFEVLMDEGIIPAGSIFAGIDEQGFVTYTERIPDIGAPTISDGRTPPVTISDAVASGEISPGLEAILRTGDPMFGPAPSQISESIGETFAAAGERPGIGESIMLAGDPMFAAGGALSKLTPQEQSAVMGRAIESSIPVYSTVRFWNEMGPVARSISIAGDVLFLAPSAIGLASKSSLATRTLAVTPAGRTGRVPFAGSARNAVMKDIEAAIDTATELQPATREAGKDVVRATGQYVDDLETLTRNQNSLRGTLASAPRGAAAAFDSFADATQDYIRLANDPLTSPARLREVSARLDAATTAYNEVKSSIPAGTAALHDEIISASVRTARSEARLRQVLTEYKQLSDADVARIGGEGQKAPNLAEFGDQYIDRIRQSSLAALSDTGPEIQLAQSRFRDSAAALTERAAAARPGIEGSADYWRGLTSSADDMLKNLDNISAASKARVSTLQTQLARVQAQKAVATSRALPSIIEEEARIVRQITDARLAPTSSETVNTARVALQQTVSKFPADRSLWTGPMRRLYSRWQALTLTERDIIFDMDAIWPVERKSLGTAPTITDIPGIRPGSPLATEFPTLRASTAAGLAGGAPRLAAVPPPLADAVSAPLLTPDEVRVEMPGAVPSATPSRAPTTGPVPSPLTPTKPFPARTPGVAPAPVSVPQVIPASAPIPTPSVTPSPTTPPAPQPQPAPSAAPIQIPRISTAPGIAPFTATGPAPAPAPAPAPQPQPQPRPQPQPQPQPRPRPTPAPAPDAPVTRVPPKRVKLPDNATELPGIVPGGPGAFPRVHGWKQGGGDTRRRGRGVYFYLDRATNTLYSSSKPLYGRIPRGKGLTPAQSHRVIARSSSRSPARSFVLGNATVTVGDRGPMFAGRSGPKGSGKPAQLRGQRATNRRRGRKAR